MLVSVNLKTSEQDFIDKCLLSVCGQLYFILSDDKKITSIMPLFSSEGRFTLVEECVL